MLLENGFNFIRHDDPSTPNQKKQEKCNKLVKHEVPNNLKSETIPDRFNMLVDIPSSWDNVQDRIHRGYYRTDVKDAETAKREQYEHNLKFSLDQKLDESTVFLLQSYKSADNVVKGNTQSKTYFCLEHLASHPNTLEILHSVVTSDKDVLKSYNGNLCDSFTFMMESKKWPEKLWKNVLEIESKISREMRQLLLEHIKELPECEQLDSLFHANGKGKMVLFEKIMSFACDESTKWTNLIPISLLETMSVFPKDVNTDVYTCILFFGVVEGDLAKCKFAFQFGHASLHKKTTMKIAKALEECCRCKYCNVRSRIKLEVAEDNAKNRSECLKFTELNDKTAMELAQVLKKKNIQNYLNEAKNPIKIQEIISDDDSEPKNVKNENNTEAPKRKRDPKNTLK